MPETPPVPRPTEVKRPGIFVPATPEVPAPRPAEVKREDADFDESQYEAVYLNEKTYTMEFCYQMMMATRRDIGQRGLSERDRQQIVESDYFWRPLYLFKHRNFLKAQLESKGKFTPEEISLLERDEKELRRLSGEKARFLADLRRTRAAARFPATDEQKALQFDPNWCDDPERQLKWNYAVALQFAKQRLNNYLMSGEIWKKGPWGQTSTLSFDAQLGLYIKALKALALCFYILVANNKQEQFKAKLTEVSKRILRWTSMVPQHVPYLPGRRSAAIDLYWYTTADLALDLKKASEARDATRAKWQAARASHAPAESIVGVGVDYNRYEVMHAYLQMMIAERDVATAQNSKQGLDKETIHILAEGTFNESVAAFRLYCVTPLSPPDQAFFGEVDKLSQQWPTPPANQAGAQDLLKNAQGTGIDLDSDADVFYQTALRCKGKLKILRAKLTKNELKKDPSIDVKQISQEMNNLERQLRVAVRSSRDQPWVSLFAEFLSFDADSSDLPADNDKDDDSDIEQRFRDAKQREQTWMPPDEAAADKITDKEWQQTSEKVTRSIVALRDATVQFSNEAKHTFDVVRQATLMNHVKENQKRIERLRRLVGYLTIKEEYVRSFVLPVVDPNEPTKAELRMSNAQLRAKLDELYARTTKNIQRLDMNQQEAFDAQLTGEQFLEELNNYLQLRILRIAFLLRARGDNTPSPVVVPRADSAASDPVPIPAPVPVSLVRAKTKTKRKAKPKQLPVPKPPSGNQKGTDINKLTADRNAARQRQREAKEAAEQVAARQKQQEEEESAKRTRNAAVDAEAKESTNAAEDATFALYLGSTEGKRAILEGKRLTEEPDFKFSNGKNWEEWVSIAKVQDELIKGLYNQRQATVRLSESRHIVVTEADGSQRELDSSEFVMACHKKFIEIAVAVSRKQEQTDNRFVYFDQTNPQRFLSDSQFEVFSGITLVKKVMDWLRAHGVYYVPGPNGLVELSEREFKKRERKKTTEEEKKNPVEFMTAAEEREEDASQVAQLQPTILIAAEREFENYWLPDIELIHAAMEYADARASKLDGEQYTIWRAHWSRAAVILWSSGIHDEIGEDLKENGTWLERFAPWFDPESKERVTEKHAKELDEGQPYAMVPTPSAVEGTRTGWFAWLVAINLHAAEVAKTHSNKGTFKNDINRLTLKADVPADLDEKAYDEQFKWLLQNAQPAFEARNYDINSTGMQVMVLLALLQSSIREQFTPEDDDDTMFWFVRTVSFFSAQIYYSLRVFFRNGVYRDRLSLKKPPWIWGALIALRRLREWMKTEPDLFSNEFLVIYRRAVLAQLKPSSDASKPRSHELSPFANENASVAELLDELLDRHLPRAMNDILQTPKTNTKTSKASALKQFDTEQDEEFSQLEDDIRSNGTFLVETFGELKKVKPQSWRNTAEALAGELCGQPLAISKKTRRVDRFDTDAREYSWTKRRIASAKKKIEDGGKPIKPVEKIIDDFITHTKWRALNFRLTYFWLQNILGWCPPPSTPASEAKAAIQKKPAKEAKEAKEAKGKKRVKSDKNLERIKLISPRKEAESKEEKGEEEPVRKRVRRRIEGAASADADFESVDDFGPVPEPIPVDPLNEESGEGEGEGDGEEPGEGDEDTESDDEGEAREKEAKTAARALSDEKQEAEEARIREETHDQFTVLRKTYGKYTRLDQLDFDREYGDYKGEFEILKIFPQLNQFWALDNRLNEGAAVNIEKIAWMVRVLELVEPEAYAPECGKRPPLSGTKAEKITAHKTLLIGFVFDHIGSDNIYDTEAAKRRDAGLPGHFGNAEAKQQFAKIYLSDILSGAGQRRRGIYFMTDKPMLNFLKTYLLSVPDRTSIDMGNGLVLTPERVAGLQTQIKAKFPQDFPVIVDDEDQTVDLTVNSGDSSEDEGDDDEVEEIERIYDEM